MIDYRKFELVAEPENKTQGQGYPTIHRGN